jgi:phage gp46-like protein
MANNDLASDEGLRTAALLSLFQDRRANSDDELPDSSGDLRGWWGDEFAEEGEDLNGSRLWLLDRSKVSEGLANSVENYCREALQWMIDDLVIDEVGFASEIEDGKLLYQVELFHGDSSTALRFEHVWDGEAANWDGYPVDDLEVFTLITEGGDALITEGGDALTTE